MRNMTKVSHVGLDCHKNFSKVTARDASNRVLFRRVWSTPTDGSCGANWPGCPRERRWCWKAHSGGAGWPTS